MNTPETDECVKNNKHIKFLEEDHWSLHGKFTYTHPIVCLCRKLERERDVLLALLASEKSTRNHIVQRAAETERERDTAIAERDEARSRFNEIDLCKNGQSPCKWSLKLIAERDAAIAERDALARALEECKEDSIELLEERDWWKDESRSDYKKRYEETRNNITKADAALAAVKPTNQND
jgi:hypothetical protein